MAKLTARVDTDAHAAITFCKSLPTRIIYCDALDAWYHQKVHVYEPLSPVRIQGIALEFTKQAQQALNLTPKEAKSLQSRSRIDNIVTLSRSRVRVDIAELDASPHLLGCRDGTILDLKKHSHGSPHHSIVTKKLGTTFDPSAKCPEWDRFLIRIFEHDESLIGFVQRATGYSLTGLTDEQCLFLLIGKGANGKSTFLGILHDLFGDYAGTVPMHTLMVSRSGNEATNDLAMLPGKRLVTASEGEQEHKLAEAKIKLMTGGDRLTVRKLYQNLFEYQPQFKLWLATNSLPKITGTDEAIWRRIRVVPFPVTIPVPERDPKLRDRLKAELPGILNWALEGLRQWSTQGLNPPPRVQDATKAYRLESDTVEQFIDACCVRMPQGRALVKDLYDRYTQWCEHGGFEAVTKVVFGKTLSQKNFDKIRHRTGTAWGGIHLKEADGPNADEGVLASGAIDCISVL